jgi:hypothetical protein
MPLSPGEGVSEGTATALTEALAVELRKRPGLTLVTARELAAVLGFERQKALAGCQSDACMAELAGALDADRVVTGQVARVGESWTLHLQVVDAKRAVALAQASRRLKGGGVDGLLDLLPEMARELFPDGASAGPLAQGPAAGAPAAAAPSAAAPSAGGPSAAAPLPPPWAEERLAKGEVDVSKLLLVTDGQGRYMAMVPFSGISGPVLAGDAKGLFLQRVFGGGSEGDRAFSFVFWEPRARVPAEASFDFREGRYRLTCGKKELDYKPVPAREAAAFLKRTPLYGVRWRRAGHALARDDEGTYYYVDRARVPEDSTDFRAYVGRRGRVVAEPAELLARDEDGELFALQAGTLRFSPGRKEAELSRGGEKRKLAFLQVEDHVQLLYTALGAYTGERLGTPCDGAF